MALTPKSIEQILVHSGATAIFAGKSLGFDQMTRFVSQIANLPAGISLATLVVFSSAWSLEDNLITPTFQIKRNEIEKVYLG